MVTDLAGVPASVRIARADEDLCDWLEVAVVAVLIGPDGQGDASQLVDLLAVVHSSAPPQGHRQSVGELSGGVVANGQTDRLDVSRQR